ncbi:uncharacterized protein EAF01_010187 [Botrytis porri]|uniref:uncharacterized protein n=1 Tax=Botrytis porri TaxID=87229 RepID=UPI0019019C20|nr:uncharacterized protein EAF01_010187 [Botrytis porri]KAF7894737.1 hypothetical protein EAF01_010187 [Botrytis porri]
MPAVTRSKSPCKKAPANPIQASSAADTSTNVAPVANMRSPSKKAAATGEKKPAGAHNALSDAMAPALAPLSPSKKKRSAKTFNGEEGVGAQSSEPMKRTRIERSDAPLSRPTSGQPDLAATTYPQVERVVLGLENTPVFGTTGGSPKEGLDTAVSTPTSSPKSVETTAVAPVLDGEEIGAMAKAPISAVTVTAGQTDDKTVVEQPSPHSAADSADPLTANEAEAHLPAAPQGSSSSDLEVAKEELAAKAEEIAELEVNQAKLRRELGAVLEERDALEIKEEETREEINRARENLRDRLEATHKLRRERDELIDQNQHLSTQNGTLSEMNDVLRNDVERLAQENRGLKNTVDGYRSAVNILNEQVPYPTSDQRELERTRGLLRAETAKTAEYEVESIEPVDPAQAGTSHENHNREEHAREDRSRRYRTPTPGNNGDNIDYVDNDGVEDDDSSNASYDDSSDDYDLPLPEAPAGGVTGTQQSNRSSSSVEFLRSVRLECRHDRGYSGNTCRQCGVQVLAEGHPESDRDRSVAPEDELTPSSSDEEERNRDSSSYEPPEADINTQDEAQQVGSPVLSGNEDSEDSDQEDESPCPSISRKRKESPVSASSPAKKVKSTETELAGPSSTPAPCASVPFQPANPGWGSSRVLSPQVAVTAQAASTSSSASERTAATSLFPTVITRSGAAIQFGAATTFGAIGSAGSSVRFGSTHSFGGPALWARSPFVAASPKEDAAEEDKPADEKK